MTITADRFPALFATLVVMLLVSCGAPETATPPPSGPDVKAAAVTYTGGGATMNGYLAYDANVEGKRPGVLVVHEWWGHNEYVRRRAEMLAELGYTALAVDMYGGGRTADHPQGASALASEVAANVDAGVERFEAAMNVLTSHETVDPERLAAIGYCFGGGVVLEMARRGIDLDGVASFHGLANPPATPTPAGTVQAKILILIGGEDPFIPADGLAAFKADLDQAGADYEVVMYDGVQHSFTNPAADSVGKKYDLPLVYDEQADNASWEAMQQLFAEIFQN